MQYRNKESNLNYSTTRTDGETRLWKTNRGFPDSMFLSCLVRVSE